jgi:hypothetical protein
MTCVRRYAGWGQHYELVGIEITHCGWKQEVNIYFIVRNICGYHYYKKILGRCWRNSRSNTTLQRAMMMLEQLENTPDHTKEYCMG